MFNFEEENDDEDENDDDHHHDYHKNEDDNAGQLKFPTLSLNNLFSSSSQEKPCEAPL